MPRYPLTLALLALPAFVILPGFLGGRLDADAMLHPTGEWAARFLIVALSAAPLAALVGPNRFIAGWQRRRRLIGLAAFAYAAAHTGFYLASMGALDFILAELAAPGIWTGWLALILMAIPAAISSDRAMRALGRHWKSLQRLVWPVALLTLLHWGLVSYGWLPALVHFVPLCALFALRVLPNRKRLPT